MGGLVRRCDGQDGEAGPTGGHRRGGSSVLLLALVVGVTAGVLVPGAVAGAQSASGAPGVTRTAITVGAVGTLSGTLATDFADLVPGVEAYFDMVNARGGINGRKIDLAYNLDDGGNPSEFTAQAHALVNQDHAFAAVGISTYWFTPGFFVQMGIPTYGYNVSDNWAGPPNLFGASGSRQCYSCIVPAWSYLIKQVKAKSVALLAYNVSTSKKACATAASMFKSAGIDVSYTDFNVPIDGNITPDIQRMQHMGSDFVISCMDANENISMARAIKQYGLEMHQLWLSGSDQSLINKYSNLIQGVYFMLESVPLTAPTKYYPGLATYLSAMRKYEPQYVGESLAIDGWISAALFVAGVKAAGSDITQQRVVQLTNKMTRFTGDGMTTVVNWQIAHTKSTFPNCNVFVKVEGKRLQSMFGKGHQVFTCFVKDPAAKGAAVKNPVPLTPPAGTPGT